MQTAKEEREGDPLKGYYLADCEKLRGAPNFTVRTSGQRKNTMQDAQKARPSHPPDLAATAPPAGVCKTRFARTHVSEQGAESCHFIRVAGMIPTAASNEGLLRPRVARARGSSGHPAPCCSILLEHARR